ncbi:MAG: PEGA domain-containing protein [Spirochaetales bacterium]|nr:PEGA domain-containing protein [Spirochaetales bacterium]
MSFKRNKISVLFPVFIFILALPLSAESGIFIVSDPLGASVILDGDPVDGKTPLLLGSVQAGSHIIEIEIDGYSKIKTELTVLCDEPQEYYFSLRPEFITLKLPARGTNEEKVIKVVQGVYDINPNTEGISIQPQYPFQGIIDGLNLAIPLLTIFSVAMTINEIQNPHYSEAVVSPFVIGSFVLGSVLTAGDVALHVHKSRLKENDFGNFADASSSKMEAEEIFKTGNIMLRKGEFSSALGEYEKIIENHKTSIYFPLAIYKTGTIKMILYRLDEAEEDFRFIVNKVPLPEIFDNSLRKLAELAIRKSRYDEALSYLDRILFICESPSKEEIQLRKCEILSLRADANPEKCEDAIIAWKNIILQFQDSDKQAIFKYSLALELSSAGLIEQADSVLNEIIFPVTDMSLLNDIVRLKEEL